MAIRGRQNGNPGYEVKGIAPNDFPDFRCRHKKACSAGSPHFTTTKASFVGPEYAKGMACVCCSCRWIPGVPKPIRAGKRSKPFSTTNFGKTLTRYTRANTGI